MIAYIKGQLEHIAQDYIIVENNEIGYAIRVPFTVIQQLPARGAAVKIYTYTYVREDAFLLYGFLAKEDLEIFKLLITVNGIGPKGALGILSAITPDNLRFAILADDVKAISKAPGIGTKTASKLILELKDKVTLEEAFEIKAAHTPVGKELTNISLAKNEAIQALVALGYSNSEALKAMGKIEITEDMDSEKLLKLGLKQIMLL